jgi:hypothetical protein
MNRGLDRIVCLLATYGFAVTIAAMSIMPMARGQEALPCPPPQCTAPALVCEHPVAIPTIPFPLSPDHLHRMLVNEQGDVTIFLTKLPHVGQLFQGTCAAPTCCEKMLARLGMAVNGGDQCAKACEAVCGSECASAGGAVCKCTDCKCCQACPGKSGEAKCGDENCTAAAMIIKHTCHQDEADWHDPLKLMQHIAGLMAEKAAAEAALEARTERQAETAELYGEIAELLADNAALDARLEAQCEQRKLLEKVADLAAENARLKAHVELAAERAELAKSTLTLKIENERLKVRVADLEQRQAGAESTRTATEPREERSSR